MGVVLGGGGGGGELFVNTCGGNRGGCSHLPARRAIKPQGFWGGKGI